MISFSLGCDKGHEFEGWFSSGDEFARLQKSGHVDCPICGSTKIEKLLMAPAVTKKSNAKSANLPVVAKSEAESKNLSAPAAPAAPQTMAMPELPPQLADAQAEVVEKIREFKKQVIANSEDVGEKFVEEARKIHFGESEKRGIYGKANIEEAIELLEDGVDVMPLPDLPEDKN